MDEEEVVTEENTEENDTPEHTIDDVYEKIEDIIEILTTNL